MARKWMALRRPDACVECRIALPAGTRAEWDADARVVRCANCARREVEPLPTTVVSAHGAPLPARVAPPSDEVGIDSGVAGSSARAEAERLRARHTAGIERRWGRGPIGQLVKAFSSEPAAATTWARGASGEERLAEILADRLGKRAVVLHDRSVPGTLANIDHIVVATSGVWVVDAKQYRGKVERRDVGGWFRRDRRLYVAGWDRTRLVSQMGWQRAAVAAAVGDPQVPVHLSLTFVGADWPLLFARPLQFDSVWVSWPRRLAELIDQPGPLNDERVQEIARRVAAALPRKR